MFEKFTDKAIKAVMLAQEEVRRLKHNFIGTEQLLLGILAEGTNAAAKTLHSCNITLKLVRREVESIIGVGTGYTDIDIPFTPRAKYVIEDSLRQAQRYGHKFIAPEHLLLALIREQEGVAVRILQELRVDLTWLEKEIVLRMKMTTTTRAEGLEDPTTVQNNVPTPTLDQFGTDLTAKARNGRLDPVIGRATELERTVQILGRRTKNNPVLLGEPGVGKTAVAEGLAQLIVSGEAPEYLSNKRVVTLEISGVVAGTKYRGEFEERLKKIITEVKASREVILVIDEMHTLIGAGASEGAVDAANILKPCLARGEVQVLGITTLEEYRKHIEKDAALARRFQPVQLEEPSVEEAIEILLGLRKLYEEYHGLRITDEAIEAAVKLGHRYVMDRFLPDKAIDLIDEAGSLKKTKYRGQEDIEVTTEDVASILSSWTGIPVNKLTESEVQRLLNLETILHERIIGQGGAVTSIARTMRRARVGLKNPNRPVGSFLFAGPTGVGKTELAKALAEFFYDEQDALIRVDMSEYMEKQATARMTGSPPGYVGYEDGGQLTELVRRKPYSVVLFDEIEKAHPDVFNILLQVLEDGCLTDAKGRKVSFKNTIIILTSNIGAQDISKGGGSLGFKGQGNTVNESIKHKVTESIKAAFRPEFLNRLDEVVVFQLLTELEVRQIVDVMLKDIVKRAEEIGYQLHIAEEVKDHLGKEGYSPVFGARPLRRAIQRLLEDPLTEAILSGSVEKGQVDVSLGVEGQINIATVVPVVNN